MELTDWQKRLLEGGTHSAFQISASEWGNPELHELIGAGLYAYWGAEGGVKGRTTDEGIAALKEAGNNG